jgi:hypothetical protein
MLGKSFRSLATVVLPRANARKLALLLLVGVLAGCGGGSGAKQASGQLVGGSGFSFRVPTGWKVTRTETSVQARHGEDLLSVTTFRLARPYAPALWPKVAAELDRVAKQLAVRVKGKVDSAETRTIAGRKARVYAISRPGADERIGFVLEGRREYQLYCRAAAGDCDTLLSSFSLSA